MMLNLRQVLSRKLGVRTKKQKAKNLKKAKKRGVVNGKNSGWKGGA